MLSATTEVAAAPAPCFGQCWVVAVAAAGDWGRGGCQRGVRGFFSRGEYGGGGEVGGGGCAECAVRAVCVSQRRRGSEGREMAKCFPRGRTLTPPACSSSHSLTPVAPSLPSSPPSTPAPAHPPSSVSPWLEGAQG